MRILYFFFILLFFTSCGTDQSDKSNPSKSEEKGPEIPMPFYSGDVVFADEFITVKKFSNGDDILHAQSKALWIKAATEGLPAWCYADSIKKQSVLYNGFCFSDERKLAAEIQFMNEIDASLFGSVFDAPEVSEVPVYLTERNYQGNFYNLGFHNIWIKGKTEGTGMKYVLSYHPSRAFVQLRRVHPGNGYFIRTLKPN